METLERPTVTVLIADDHPLMRQGIRLSLAGQASVTVVGEAADGDEALVAVASLLPDIVILDLDMPKRDGLSVVRKLNRQKSKVGIIILTLHTGADLIAEAMELGIRGYIIKTSATVEIVEAVSRVAGGGSYLSAAAVDAMATWKAGIGEPDELGRLSPIELRLVRNIAEGRTSREIAASLELSGRTIENYRTAICNKLDLSGPNALLRYALERRDDLKR